MTGTVLNATLKPCNKDILRTGRYLATLLLVGEDQTEAVKGKNHKEVLRK